MSASYYFLNSTLIPIELGAPLPLSYEQLYSETDRWLPPRQAAMVRELTLLSHRNPAFPDAINTYLDWEHSLRNRLVFLRCYRNHVDPQPHLREGEVRLFAAIDSIVHEAMNLDPLEKERYLDRARFMVVDMATAMEHFSLANILAYKLKMVVAEKWCERTHDRGEKNFKRLLGEVTGKISNLQSFNLQS